MDKLEAGKLLRRETILEVRAELVGSVPAIWRQLEIRGSLALNQVHQVLQAAFGWEDTHLHRFTPDNPFAPLRPVNGEYPESLPWLPEQECEEPGDRPEEECTLDQLLALGSGTAFYEYDFGDGWLHRLELVSRRPATSDAPPARLVGGARRGPLEDSGGLPGYEEITDALIDPYHPDHAENSAWVAEITGSDEPFDPAFLVGLFPGRDPAGGVVLVFGGSKASLMRTSQSELPRWGSTVRCTRAARRDLSGGAPR